MRQNTQPPGLLWIFRVAKADCDCVAQLWVPNEQNNILIAGFKLKFANLDVHICRFVNLLNKNWTFNRRPKIRAGCEQPNLSISSSSNSSNTTTNKGTTLQAAVIEAAAALEIMHYEIFLTTKTTSRTKNIFLILLKYWYSPSLSFMWGSE